MCKDGTNSVIHAVQNALRFLHNEQEHDGTWFGRWGCNYVYGTWLVLRSAQIAGEDMSDARYQSAAQWLRSVQNADGGWGELPRSYDDPKFKGLGPSTPSQTAWALMGLMATGDLDSSSVELGIEYAEAYLNTKNPVYLSRAKDAFKFILSGWTDQLGGGVYWLEGHRDQKPA